MSVEERVQERLASGDLSGAATEAIRGLGPRVVGYLRTILHDEVDVTDAFSHWAESLWRGLGSFEGRSSFKTWALRLAFNSALKLRDKAYRRHERRLATSEASALADEIRTSTPRYESRRERLAELRAELSPEEQTLLFLRIDQELAWEDIAAVLSEQGKAVDAGSARKRFERLKTRLAKLARERGLVE